MAAMMTETETPRLPAGVLARREGDVWVCACGETYQTDLEVFRHRSREHRERSAA